MPAYMKLGDIKGEVTQENHKGWIDIVSVSLGVARHVTTPVGRAANRESSEPTVSDISISKAVDSASVPIFQESVTSSKGGMSVTIDFCNTDDGGHPYMQYILSNALVSSYSVSGSGDSPPMEQLSLNYTKLEFKYVVRDDKGKGSKPMVGSYDVATAKKG